MKGIANRLMKAVKDAREKRIQANIIIAQWEAEFDTAFLGDADDTEHIQILIDALVRSEEE